jgi:hypothetical protein
MSELKTNKISTNDQNNVAIDNALGLKSYTTAQRDALTSVAGDMIYNSDDAKVQVYSGSAWEDLGGVATASISYLVIGGGGAGAGSQNQEQGQGGGGAGGYLNSYSTETSGGNQSTLEPITVLADGTTTYQVTVGAGGAKVSANVGNNGNPSQFHSAIAQAGGRGGHYLSGISMLGGSGGGTARYVTSNSSYYLRYPAFIVTGLGTQGSQGGEGNTSGYGGGGGGAGGNGSNASGSTGGAGGAGLASSITGTSVTRAGGGGGGTNGTGGSGGGGAGGNSGTDGTVNTGSGGGGSGAVTNTPKSGGSGGSGIVILRWATADATIGATRTGLTDGGVQTDGSDSYIVFTEGTGTITFS